MPQPVKALWYVGRLPGARDRNLAIVGARAATMTGCRTARELAAASARSGMTIVSGGALGIDAAAHRGALDAGGVTFAVLGCGVDIVYPARNAVLFDEIAASGGGLLSEYPPGTQPRNGQFPARNRIIAALAENVLVVEAGLLSGALITANHARRLGRTVLAVPGSPGADQLIANGAAFPVFDAESLAAVLAGEPLARPVPPRYAALMAELANGPVGPAELSRRLSLPLAETLALTAEAELDGWICRRPGGALASIALASMENKSRGN